MKLGTICFTAAAALAGASANAATLDFTIPTGGFTVQGYTSANAIGGGTADPSAAISGSGQLISEAGFNTILLDVDGENLDIFINDVASGNAYFDADSNGKPGGLGSCRDLNSLAQCVPSSDDNLTLAADETIRMDFFIDGPQPIGAVFGDFKFRDDDHNLINGTVSVSHDSGYSIIDVIDGIGDFSVVGSSGYLVFNDDGGAGSTSNYYISEATVSAVPVPAAVWLFGSGLGMLGWMRRKRAV